MQFLGECQKDLEALRAAVGWDLLKDGLRVHHRAEDEALWPALRGNVAGRPCDLADSVVTGLTGHLAHEEEAALPLVQEVVTPEQWARFGQVHAARIGPGAPRLLPWLLDGAEKLTATKMLALLPAPARRTYEHQWLLAYAELDPWGAVRGE
ncbi:hypothetical protein [Streptomyces sp. NPDC002640]